jgi:hypothetical protein
MDLLDAPYRGFGRRVVGRDLVCDVGVELVTQSPARIALNELVDHLMESTPNFGWSFERVHDLALTDEQIAVVLEAEPDELMARLNRRDVTVAVISEALKLDDDQLRVVTLGVWLQWVSRRSAEEELLSQLEAETARREEDATETDAQIAEREQFDTRETFS